MPRPASPNRNARSRVPPRLCDRDNAAHVLQLPEQTANRMLCALHGQAYLAGTSLELTAGEYPKILCIRSRQRNVG